MPPKPIRRVESKKIGDGVPIYGYNTPAREVEPKLYARFTGATKLVVEVARLIMLVDRLAAVDCGHEKLPSKAIAELEVSMINTAQRIRDIIDPLIMEVI